MIKLTLFMVSYAPLLVILAIRDLPFYAALLMLTSYAALSWGLIELLQDHEESYEIADAKTVSFEGIDDQASEYIYLFCGIYAWSFVTFSLNTVSGVLGVLSLLSFFAFLVLKREEWWLLRVSPVLVACGFHMVEMNFPDGSSLPIIVRDKRLNKAWCKGNILSLSPLESPIYQEIDLSREERPRDNSSPSMLLFYCGIMALMILTGLFYLE